MILWTKKWISFCSYYCPLGHSGFGERLACSLAPLTRTSHWGLLVQKPSLWVWCRLHLLFSCCCMWCRCEVLTITCLQPVAEKRNIGIFDTSASSFLCGETLEIFVMSKRALISHWYMCQVWLFVCLTLCLVYIVSTLLSMLEGPRMHQF